MIGDYQNEISHRRYEPLTGTGSAVQPIPADAWLVAYSFTAGLTDATLVITLADSTVYDTLTVRAGGSWSSPPIADRGRFAGASFAFSDTVDFVVELARNP